MREYLKSLQRSELGPLLLIWTVATACNLSKAIHMDDPVHLYAARAILKDPFRPYDAQILWGWILPGPLSDITQPPLLFYGLAGVIGIFGENEIALHAFMSLFTLGIVLCFHRLAAIFDRSNAVWATVLLVLSPSFLPSQNLMTDVPLLFFYLLFLCLVLSCWEGPAESRKLIGAGFAAGAACLTKYSGLVLVVLLPVAAILHSGLGKRGHFKRDLVKRSLSKIWIVIIPSAMLVLWMILSFLDTGRVHLNQPAIGSAGTLLYENSVDWVVCLGAITPYSLLFLPAIARDYRRALIVSIVCAVCIFWFPQRLLDPASERADLIIWARAFWINGIITSLATLICLLGANFRFPIGRTQMQTSETFAGTNTDCRPSIESAGGVLCALWFIGSFCFICIFAKFIAVRHVFLVTPVTVIALVKAYRGKSRSKLVNVAAIVTAALGVLLAVSDYRFAEVYRSQAKVFAERFAGESNVWAVGHWGWQWYAKGNGMKLYDWNSDLRDGDFIIVPDVTHKHLMRPEHLKLLVKTESVTVPGGWGTLLRTVSSEPWGGFYASRGNSIPIRINHDSLERFTVFQVQKLLQKNAQLPIVIRFNESEPKGAVLSGFHQAEYWGRWTATEEASIHFDSMLPSQFRVVLNVRTFGKARARPIRVRAGTFMGEIELSQGSQVLILDVNSESAVRSIVFEIPDRSSALLESAGRDSREIGIGIEQLLLELP